MGLFSKKQCSLCGADIGLLSNKKLADGNVCKNCRKQFSPFWEADRGTTVQEVQAHLTYREQNRAALAAFQPTKQIGKDELLYLDEAHGKFVLCEQKAFPVSNPDVFDISSITECDFDIVEHESRDEDGKADYYEYNFILVLSLNHPYLPYIHYCVNGSSVRSKRFPVRRAQAEQIYYGQKESRGHLLSALTGIDKSAMDEYVKYYGILQDMVRALTGAAQTQQAATYTAPAQPVSAQPATPTTPQTAHANFCPNCGAKSNGGAFCTECGTKL